MSFNCSKCKREFDSEEIYDKHVKLNRCKEPYVCKKCEYATNRKADYARHINTKKCKKNTRPSKFKCERCDAMFRDNYDLTRHLNKKKSCISTNVIYQNKIKVESTSDHYIYILQDRTSLQLNQNIYKIGKTKQTNLKRFGTYPKGYKIMMLIDCFDCDEIETKLIELFKKKYIHIREYGNEYFQGNLIEMKKDIMIHVLYK
jgi:uncharacterized C2H2 Zn-finger protein